MHFTEAYLGFGILTECDVVFSVLLGGGTYAHLYVCIYPLRSFLQREKRIK